MAFKLFTVKNVWWFFALGIGLILLGIGLVQGVTYQYIATPTLVTSWNNGSTCINETITSTTNYTINFSIAPPNRGEFNNATITVTPSSIATLDTFQRLLTYPNASAYKFVEEDGSLIFTNTENFDDNNNDTFMNASNFAGHLTNGDGYVDFSFKVNYTYSAGTRFNITSKVQGQNIGGGSTNAAFWCWNWSSSAWSRVYAADLTWPMSDGVNYTQNTEMPGACIDPATNNITMRYGFGVRPRVMNIAASILFWEISFYGNISSSTNQIINVSILLNNTYLANTQTLTTNKSINLASTYLNNSYYSKNWSLITVKTNGSQATFQVCAANFTIEDRGIVIGNATFFNIERFTGTNWTRSPYFNYNYTCYPGRSVLGAIYVDGNLISYPTLTCDNVPHIATVTPTATTTGNHTIALTVIPDGTSSWTYFTDVFFYDLTSPTLKVNVTWNPTGPNGSISLQCNDSEYTTLLYNWTWNGALVEKINLTNATIRSNHTGINLQNLMNYLNASCSDLFNSAYRSYTIMNQSLAVWYLDENTGSSITENVTLEVIQNDTLYNYYSTTGSLNVWRHNESTPIWLGTYDIGAFSSSYAKRNGVVTFSGNDNQTYTFYLANQSSTVQLTIQEKLTKDAISEAIVTLSRIIGSSWVEIAGKQSDITGKVVFSYTPNVRYRFNVTKTGYDAKVFYLDPIIFTSYTVELDQTSSGYYALDFDDVQVNVDPHIFTADKFNYLNVSIRSGSSSLNSYSFSVCYPGGCNTSSGAASAGETLSTVFNITGAKVWDVVELNITYDTDFSGSRTFSYQYTINGQTYSRYTWVANRTNFLGTGWLERITFATFILILIVGVITLTAGPLAGGAVFIVMLGFFAYLKFIPVWGILASLVVGVILLGKRASE